VTRLLSLAFALGVLAVGCGGGDNASTTTSTTTTTAPAQTTALRVYFLRKGQVWPVFRQIDTTGGVATGAVAKLLQGPTDQERSDLGLTTSIPVDVQSAEISIADGVATVKPSSELPDKPLAQFVYTLTQFPTVKSVEVNGKRYTRTDFEAETPPILVESPLSFQRVSTPLRVKGTANTFEATFNYELTDPDGKIISKHFETATSGSGTRGTFDFTVPFTVDRDGIGELVVLELSAKDGSRIHIQEIPLRMTR
jgi:hypothetical protein